MWNGFANLIAGDDEVAGVVAEPHVRFGYATGLWHRPLLRVIPSLDTAADSLKEYLVTEAGAFERLVLVGHSQGGLVIQRCLVRMLAEGRGRELVRVRRVVLLATPNTGSQLLLGLRRKLIWGNAQERALRPFDELVADTRRIVMRDLVNAQEVTERTCPIPFSVYAGESDAVVTPASARDVFPEAAALPGDHFSIAKPDSRQHRTYATVRRLLRQAAAEGDRDPPEADPKARVLRGGVVPAPPEWAVAREQTETVVAAVVDAGPSTTVGITTAVYGAGGFGKSTVAQLVCADPRVREWFGDRVYWVTVGWGQRTRDRIAAKVSEATALITGEKDQFTDPLAAGSYLGSLLQEAELPVLLVLDDVWEAAQLSPFLLGAPNCLRLVTTRIKGVLPRSAAAVLVDRLERAQALALVTDGLPGLPANLAEQLVAACGRWALLLRLANRWIADQAATDDDPAEHARSLLERLAAGPAAVDRPAAMVEVEDPQARNELVEASMRASLGLLAAPARRRFLELGAFAPDEPIPIRVLARLWGVPAGMDDAAVRLACRDLERLALIGIDPSDGGAVLVHDVLHAYARAALRVDGVRTTHRALIRAVEDSLPVAESLDPAAMQCAQAAWWQLAPERDGYLLDHAVELLCSAGEQEQAEALTSDLRWVDARLLQHGPTAPIRDLLQVGGSDAEARAADLTRIAHLLTLVEPRRAAVDTLHSYLQASPAWSWSVAALAARPSPHDRLINAWPPPDRPQPGQRNTLSNLLGFGTLRTLIFSQDGERLLAGGAWGSFVVLQCWHLDTGTPAYYVGVVQEPTGGVRVAALDESGVIHEANVDSTLLGRMAIAGGDAATTGADSDPGWSAAMPSLVAFAEMQVWLNLPSVALVDLYRRTLNTSSTDVTVLAIAPTGEWLVAGESTGNVRVWRLPDTRLCHTMIGHDGGVTAVAIARDSTWLVTGGQDQLLRIWDIATGRLVRTLAGHRGTVRAVTVAPDGATVASGSDDGTVYIWETATGALTRTLRTGGQLTTLAISPDNTRIAIDCGFPMGSVQVWDLPAAHPRSSSAKAGTGTAVELYRHGAVALRDGPRVVRVWDPSEDVPRQPPTGRGAIAVGPQGILAASDEDHTVRLWRLPDYTIIRTLVGHAAFVRAIAVGPGESIASADDHGVVRLWRPGTGRLTETRTGVLGQQYAVAFTRSGPCITAYRRGDVVRIWSVDTGALIHTLTDVGLVEVLKFSADGALLATGSRDGPVRIWDIATGKVVNILPVNGPGTDAIAFSPNASRVAVARSGADGLIQVWNVATGAVEHTFTNPALNTHVAFAPEGAWLASTGYAQNGRIIRVWDLSRGVCAAALVIDEGDVFGAAWGSILVVAGERGLHGYRFKAAGT